MQDSKLRIWFITDSEQPDTGWNHIPVFASSDEQEALDRMVEMRAAGFNAFIFDRMVDLPC